MRHLVTQRLLITSVLAVVASGCISVPSTSGRAPTMSRPAPATALDCALRVAVDSLFRPVSGGVASGYLTLQRPYHATGNEQLGNLALRFSTFFMVGLKTPTIDELQLTGAGARLQAVALSWGGDGRQMGTSAPALAVAQTVLNVCAP